MIVSRWILLRMKNASDKCCRENRNTHFMFSNYFFPRKSCLLRENVEDCCVAGESTNGNTTRRMRFAWRITKATDTRSEYVTRIAFPRQQWLRERTSMLRSTYTPCLVNCCTWSLSLCDGSLLTLVPQGICAE